MRRAFSIPSALRLARTLGFALWCAAGVSEARAKDSTNPEVERLIHSGKGYLEEKEPSKAAAEFEKALALDAENGELYRLLGESLLAGGNNERAVRVYKRYVELDPDRCDARAGLGFAYLRQGLADQAVVEYEKALSLCAGNAVAYRNLGTAYLQADDPIEAIAAFRRAAELAPDDVLTYETLGRLFFERKLYPEAIAAYETILGLPQHGKDAAWIAWANDRLGFLYFACELDANAVACYQRALAKTPEDPSTVASATEGLAAAFERMGQMEQAIHWRTKVLEGSRENPESYYRLAELQIAVGRSTEALEKAQEGRRLDKGCGARGLWILGRAHRKLGNPQQAEAMFREAVSCNDPRYSSEAAKEMAQK
jgi:tetratricopeptide (TPR) repeat protein